MGGYSYYEGGGYVHSIDNLSMNKLTLIQELVKLEEYGWVDEHTRAVFVEFSLYNANTNLFVHFILLFEYLPSGTFLNSVNINMLSLYDNVYSRFLYALDIIYMVFIIIFTIREMIKVIRKKKKYFYSLWVIVNWSLIGFSWVTFVSFMYKFYEIGQTLGAIRENNSLNLQKLIYWNDLVALSLGMCAFLGTIKFIQILAFIPRISFLINMLKNNLKELWCFLIVFVNVLVPFISLIYLFFNKSLLGFSSYIKSVLSAFLIILGKFDLSVIQTNVFLETFLIAIYNIIIVIVLTNMLIQIVTKTFSKTRREYYLNEKSKEDSMIYNYVKNMLVNAFGSESKKKANNKQQQQQQKQHSYNTYDLTYLDRQVDNLILKTKSFYEYKYKIFYIFF